MKLKYKKLVIIITVATLALSFLILTLIPTGGSNPDSAQDAKLLENENQQINQLITDYFNAKKTVNVEAMADLVSDSSQIDKTKFTSMAEYVEDYQNINCYVIENEDKDAYRVYVKYDMKLKNINTLAPCLGAFYVTATSDGKYVIYLSALDEVQESFIEAADKNKAIVELKNQVSKKLQEAINQDESFKQLYQRMDSQIKSASTSNAANQANTNTTAVPVSPAAAQ